MITNENTYRSYEILDEKRKKEVHDFLNNSTFFGLPVMFLTIDELRYALMIAMKEMERQRKNYHDSENRVIDMMQTCIDIKFKK